MQRSGKVIVLGLDGGTWNAILPLVRVGLMPAFDELLKRGAWGDLRSTFPPISCPAWFSFSTGTSPGKLGMYDFWGMEPGSYKVRYHSYAGVPFPDFWDLLNDAGFSCGIVNDPLVYAKRAVNGYVVPGFIVHQASFSTHPKELRRELDEVAGGYEVDQYAHYLIDDEQLFEGCLRIMRKRWRVFNHLLSSRPTDMFLGVITETDRIFHRFYRNLEDHAEGAEDAARSLLIEFMRELDRGLSEVLEVLRPEDCLMLVSDHGFEEKRQVFLVNQWLLDAGFLALKKPLPRRNSGLSQRELALRLSRLGLLDPVKRYVPRRLVSLFPKGPGRDRERFIHDLIDEDLIDWERTRVVYLDGFRVNTTDRPMGTVAPLKVPALLDELESGISRALKEATPSCSPSFLHPEEVYPGNLALNAPELMLDVGGPVSLKAALQKEGGFLKMSTEPNHHRDGMFLMVHPDVEPGRLEEDAELIDMAPTILCSFGLKPGTEMQGQPMAACGLFTGGTLDGGASLKDAALRTGREMERIRKGVEKLRRLPEA